MTQPKPSPNSKTQRAKVAALVFCFVVIPLVLLVLALRSAAAQITAQTAGPKHYDQLTFPALPAIKLPPYSRFELNNGMVVYLMEDHDLPLIGGTALIRTGDRFEPADQVGLAGLTGAVWRSGGTDRHPPDQLNAILEQKAAGIEAGIGTVSGSVGFSALSEDLPLVFDLFAEVVQRPAFDEAQFQLAKYQTAGGIARRNDSPDGIAGRELGKLIYGAASPYARSAEYASLKNIQRQDLVKFYQTWVRPDRMILGIVGDFEPQAMRARIEAQFGAWRPSGLAAGAVTPVKASKTGLPTVAQAQTSGVFFVNQPQLTQSKVQLAHLGGQVDSPDYPALSVMDEVLNSFGGRLFNEVRSRQGLAYSVYASWSPEFDYPGTFVAGGDTRSAATVPLIKALRQEIERIRTAPISAAELKSAQDTTLNSFVFNFQDPSQTLSRLMRYEYFGYPTDLIFRYRSGVEATTIGDVQRVAKDYLRPDRLVTLVVGNASEINPPLTSLGQKVQTLDITIPPNPDAPVGG
jgi:zinc protease